MCILWPTKPFSQWTQLCGLTRHSSSQGLLTAYRHVCASPQVSHMIHIHVHTLAYQAILTVDTTLWPHSDIAAAKASLTAYRHVCASPQVSLYDTHPCAYSGLPSHSHSGHNSVASLDIAAAKAFDCVQTCLCLSSAILTVDTTLWPHSDIAAAKASLTAYRHVCASPQVSLYDTHPSILTVDTTLWPHSDIAAAKASLTAYRHVCASPQVSLYDTHPCAYSGLPSHSHSGHNSVASLGHSSSQGLLDCIQTCLCLSSAILTVDTTLWPHSDIAAAKASLTAYRHVCASPQVSLYDTHPCAYSGLPSHSHSGHNSVASLGHSSSQGLLDCIQTCLCLSSGQSI
ncbi:hypothetical protein J6590_099168 [Homalodisca vitripennis]|nr:hypothetical protein J6590_099168 [Homalodisca vitripennis]